MQFGGHYSFGSVSVRIRCICEMALKPYGRFHICAEPETERRTENVHDFDLIFFCFGGRISTNTTGNFDKFCIYTTTCVVYNLVILKTIDGLSSSTIVQLFYKLNTGYYRLLWDNTQSDYKDHELNAVIWSNLYCKGISDI